MNRRELPWLLALVPVVLHLIAAGRYDFFRDELYFIACGRHPAFGYVDQPPLVPLLAALTQIGGERLVLLRAIPAVADGGAVLATCALVRLFGGAWIAELLAGLGVGLATVILGETSTLNTTAFEPLLWTLVVYGAARAVAHSKARWWIPTGIVAGVALETKYTILFLLVALLLSLAAVGPRETLRTRAFGLGVLLASAIALPSLIWQVAHGLPFIELLRAGAEGKNVVLAPLAWIATQILIYTPFAAILWIVGAGALGFSRSLRAFRFLGLTFALLFFTFLALHAKDYYLVGAYPLAFAAGAVFWERTLRKLPALAVGYAAIAACGATVLVPLVVPLLPIESFVGYQTAVLGTLHITPPKAETADTSPIPQTYADQFGWRELAATVTRVAATLSADERAHSAIYTQNYGEAGALDFYGRGLPPAISGHNSYWLWGEHDATIFIIVGGRLADHRRAFSDVREASQSDARFAMPYERNLRIFIARGMRVPRAGLWQGVRHYD